MEYKQIETKRHTEVDHPATPDLEVVPVLYLVPPPPPPFPWSKVYPGNEGVKGAASFIFYT